MTGLGRVHGSRDMVDTSSYMQSGKGKHRIQPIICRCKTAASDVSDAGFRPLESAVNALREADGEAYNNNGQRERGPAVASHASYIYCP